MANRHQFERLRLIISFDFGTAVSSAAFYCYRADRVHNFVPGELDLSQLKRSGSMGRRRSRQEEHGIG